MVKQNRKSVEHRSSTNGVDKPPDCLNIHENPYNHIYQVCIIRSTHLQLKLTAQIKLLFKKIK